MSDNTGHPAFSVIIPAYNCAHFIGAALHSVLHQTCRDFEIIVVDDGSTDNTGNAVAAFSDTRVCYYRQEPSGRPACARNAGIRRARGAYIAFLDADDIWYPQKLEHILKIFSGNPDIGLVCNDELVWRDGHAVRNNIYGPAAGDMVERLLLKGNALSTSATVVRKAWLEQVGGFCERDDYYAWKIMIYGSDWQPRAAGFTFCMKFSANIACMPQTRAASSAPGILNGSTQMCAR